MPNESKFRFISGRAPGYWGNSIRCRIQSEMIPDKVLSMNYDKIMAMGLPFAVWQEARSVLASPSTCSCYKDTSKQPDVPCGICYGTGATPGYLKFGTRNYWAESTAAGWTLTNISLDTVNRPNRLQLSTGALTGTAVSPNITISVTGKLGSWESSAQAFTRDGGVASSIVVEASVNNGATWFALSALETQAPTTQLRFRVTFTRSAATVKSPMFEIVRARFATMLDTMRNEVQEPVIRALPTWDVEQEAKQNSGIAMQQNQVFWTLPLNFFDETLSPNTVTVRLQDDVFVEARYGGNIGVRFPLNEFKYSDTFGIFTRQEFNLRRAVADKTTLAGEIYHRVW